MPDSPKKMTESPAAPTLTALCMGSTPSSGSRSFMTVNALFLISPAYSVPTMSTSIRRRWTRMAVSVRVPSVAGSALNEGTQMIVKFGAKAARSAAAGRRNRLRAKRLAQAVSVYTRSERRCPGCAPMWQSWAYRSRSAQYATRRARRRS